MARGANRLVIFIVRIRSRAPVVKAKKAMSHQWIVLNHQGVAHPCPEAMEIMVTPRK